MRNAQRLESSSSSLVASASGIQAILTRLGIEIWTSLVFRPGGEAPAGLDIPGLAATPFRGAILVAFPYDPRPVTGRGGTKLSPSREPFLRVGAFASFHRYASLSRLLKAAARDLAAATGEAYGTFRVAVNSRLPEKLLAESSGLGFRGRSDLLLSHAYGPACILGLLLLPFEPPLVPGPGKPEGKSGLTDWETTCGTCHACADACPSSAIEGPSVYSNRSASPPGCTTTARDSMNKSVPSYHREACIQHWMSTREHPPAVLKPAFSGRLYGCDACILACPRSSGAWRVDREDGSSPASRAERLLLPGERRPGALIPARFLRTATDEELKAFFRKTALGFAWLGPDQLRHNAALAGYEPAYFEKPDNPASD